MTYTFEDITPDSVIVCEEESEYPLTREAAVNNLAHLLLEGPKSTPEYHRERVQFYRDALKEMAEAAKRKAAGSNTDQSSQLDEAGFGRGGMF